MLKGSATIGTRCVKYVAVAFITFEINQMQLAGRTNGNLWLNTAVRYSDNVYRCGAGTLAFP